MLHASVISAALQMSRTILSACKGHAFNSHMRSPACDLLLRYRTLLYSQLALTGLMTIATEDGWEGIDIGKGRVVVDYSVP